MMWPADRTFFVIYKREAGTSAALPDEPGAFFTDEQIAITEAEKRALQEPRKEFIVLRSITVSGAATVNTRRFA